ncbi:MAG: hypothetical protein ACKOYC_10135 [Bacteroidota bacterium]
MIAEEVVFDKYFICVGHDPETRMLRLKWRGYATPQDFRECLSFILSYVRENDIEYCFSDLKFMSTILPQDEEWATRFWYPRLVGTALRKHAVVSSLDFLNNAAMRRIVGSPSAPNGIETRFFVDSEQAMNWLDI